MLSYYGVAFLYNIKSQHRYPKKCISQERTYLYNYTSLYDVVSHKQM